MDKSSRPYNLEQRTFTFASDVRTFVHALPKAFILTQDIKQLLRSSGSVCANYAEATEALSKKDFCHRLRICRKESKESIVWLRLLCLPANQELEERRKQLIDESRQLVHIFRASIETASKSTHT